MDDSLQMVDADLDPMIQAAKDRIRIFMILYVFGEPHTDPKRPNRKLIFETETKLQKLDFLLRYPDYLAYELLGLVQRGEADSEEVRAIVCEILDGREPELRRNDMRRFFYGAYEDLDDVIAFLHGVGFVIFESKRTLNLKVNEKRYFVTDRAIQAAEAKIDSFPFIRWYLTRCELIKRFFGHMSAADLKKRQYALEKIADASLKEYISGMSEQVNSRFEALYGETSGC